MFPQHSHRWTSKPHRCLSAFSHAPSTTVKSVTGTRVPPARCTKENEALFSTASRRELCHLRQPSICLKSVGHAADSHAESLSGRSLLPNPCPLPAARCKAVSVLPCSVIFRPPVKRVGLSASGMSWVGAAANPFKWSRCAIWWEFGLFQAEFSRSLGSWLCVCV